MTEKNEAKIQLKNLQQLIKLTSSLLEFCSDSSKEKFTDVLVDEFQAIIEKINCLNEEVKKGNITLEMARIDMNYWIDENNWKEARILFDSTNYPKGSAAHERLREAMRTMQKSLGTLHRSLQQAPAECYQRFYEMCFDKSAAEKVDKDLDHFKVTFMTEENMPQGLVYYLQRVTYRLFERGFLHFALFPLQNSDGRKFEFDFNLLYREGAESEETKFFCVCLNHYLTMPDKYTVYLNKEKLGKYLFDHYVHLTDSDLYTISYYDVAISRYNHEVEIRGLQDSEQENETARNILEQPAAMVLWEKLQNEGIVDEHLMPSILLSKTQLAIVVELFCASLQIKTTWKPFEELWGMKNLRTYYNKIQYTEFFDDFRKNLKELLAA